MPSIIELEDEGNTRCAVCREIASLKCSGCKEVAYCGKEHQKENWKLHKPKCKKLSYEIKSNPQLGRYLVTTTDLSPGGRILIDRPLTMGPKMAYPDPICLGCHKPLDQRISGSSQWSNDFSRCPRCLWPACSTQCEGLTDAHTHAPECTILRLGAEELLISNNYKYEAIFPLRCLILQRRSPKKYQEIKQMEAHMKQRGPGTEVYEEVNTIVQYLQSHFLSKLPHDVLDDTSVECLHRMCGVIDVNAVDTADSTQALYSLLCLLEHSCVPNVKYTFEPGTVDPETKLVATVPIAKDAHLSTMYTNALWGTQARREHLVLTKYFNCCCERCSDPTELGTYFSAMKCLNDHKDKDECWILPANPLLNDSDWKCGSCTAILNASDVHHVTSELGEQVDTLVRESPNVKALEEMVTKLEAMFHPNHYHCYAVKHSLIQLYGTQPGFTYAEMSNTTLDRKINLCRQLIWITNQLDAGHGRLLMYLGVLNYELHSALLELVQRNSKPADNLDKSSNDTKKHKEVKLGNSEASLKGKRGNSNKKKAKSAPTAAEKTEVAPTSVEGKLSRPACMTKEKQSRLVQEAKSLLEENLKLLEHEPPSTTGYDMGVLTKISLGQIDNLLKKYVNDQ